MLMLCKEDSMMQLRVGRVPLILGLLVLAWCSVAPVNSATIPVSTSELISLSTNVLRGVVTTQQSYWNNDRSFIYTIVKVRVEDQLKGDLGSSREIEVWLPGGEVDDMGLAVEHAAQFELGQDVFLFLKPSGDMFDITGWEQGKFTVQNNQVIEKGLAVPQFIDEINRAQR